MHITTCSRAVILCFLVCGFVSNGTSQTDLMFALSDSIVPNNEPSDGEGRIWDPSSPFEIRAYGNTMDGCMIDLLKNLIVIILGLQYQ